MISDTLYHAACRNRDVSEEIIREYEAEGPELMPVATPKSKPQQPREVTAADLIAHGVRDAVALIGYRGYYRDTLGEPGRNDRGIYDDALMVYSPEVYATFNANTDPSRYATGIASLATGVWRYKIGIHGLSKPARLQYRALVQAGPVTVIRDKQGPDTGMFGINIHRGGVSTTSSLGCQTIHPDQWTAFLALVEAEMKRHALKSVPYLLIER